MTIHSSKAFPSITVVLLLLAATAQGARSQQRSGSNSAQKPIPKSTLMVPKEPQPAPIAKEREVVCGGYLKAEPTDVAAQIVGAEQEQEQHLFVQGNNIFISAGRHQGIEVGQEFSVIRPRGKFKSPYSKKGDLGVYTQELGHVRVIGVRNDTSVAVVTQSCESMLLGDLIVPLAQRAAPVIQLSDRVDHLAELTGKQNGRIVLARDGLEMPTVNNVVYIDLGAEDNIKPGDVFTIYRSSDTPRIVKKHEEEISRNTRSGFQSDWLKGGTFSIDSARIQNQNTPEGSSPTMTTPEIKNRRPPVPRKIAGELVVTGVQQRTAAAVITRATQEVHTGDYVELK